MVRSVYIYIGKTKNQQQQQKSTSYILLLRKKRTQNANFSAKKIGINFHVTFDVSVFRLANET